jgi:hypothetical protein
MGKYQHPDDYEPRRDITVLALVVVAALYAYAAVCDFVDRLIDRIRARSGLGGR